MARSRQPAAQRSLRAADAAAPAGDVVDHQADLGGGDQQLLDRGEKLLTGRRQIGRVAIGGGSCDPARLVRQDEVEPADPGGAQLASELRQAGQRRPHEHRVGHRLEADGLQVGHRGHDVVVAAGAAQLVVDGARPVDAGQGPKEAAPRAAQFGRRGFAHVAVEEEARMGLVRPGDVVEQFDEVVAQQGVAADEHEARGAQRDALVDDVLPLRGRQLAGVPGGVLVVAVTAVAAAAVRDVQVDLAEAEGRLAAQRRVTVEAREHGEIGGLVDVHPQRQLHRLESACSRGAQRVGQERRCAHR